MSPRFFTAGAALFVLALPTRAPAEALLLPLPDMVRDSTLIARVKVLDTRVAAAASWRYRRLATATVLETFRGAARAPLVTQQAITRAAMRNTLIAILHGFEEVMLVFAPKLCNAWRPWILCSLDGSPRIYWIDRHKQRGSNTGKGVGKKMKRQRWCR